MKLQLRIMLRFKLHCLLILIILLFLELGMNQLLSDMQWV